MAEVIKDNGELSPAEKFVGILDGHFAAVGGGEQDPNQPDAESIKLRGADTNGLLGDPPVAVWASRPRPGQETPDETAPPEDSGHRVQTHAYRSQRTSASHTGYSGSRFALENTYFAEKDGGIGVRYRFIETTRGTTGRRQIEDIRRSGSSTDKLDPRQTEEFLGWLERATPEPPEPPQGP